jgi:hypothetical protein
MNIGLREKKQKVDWMDCSKLSTKRFAGTLRAERKWCAGGVSSASMYIANCHIGSSDVSLGRFLIAPFEERDTWTLNVMLVDGALYFEEQFTEEQLKEK